MRTAIDSIAKNTQDSGGKDSALRIKCGCASRDSKKPRASVQYVIFPCFIDTIGNETTSSG
jgi:hypothetical protein